MPKDHKQLTHLEELYEERAAIREFDGGQDRSAAEAAAREEIKCLLTQGPKGPEQKETYAKP
jgi:hypothetical protein